MTYFKRNQNSAMYKAAFRDRSLKSWLTEPFFICDKLYPKILFKDKMRPQRKFDIGAIICLEIIFLKKAHW